MVTVGIIANPAAGRDVRRLVAHASVFDNNEKVNIVRRVLLALDALGVERVVMMPDAFAMGSKATDGISLALAFDLLTMAPTFKAEDSTRAARLMREMGVACIVTLGGDGTNRAVAKGCGSVPLLPISTGTNNAFPRMVEGTVAGMAAALVARRVVEPRAVVRQMPCLEVWRDEERIDLALVDVVVVDEQFVGARAVWDVSKVRQIVLARVQPGGVGFSAVGGLLPDLEAGSDEGVALELGPGGLDVLAPIAPGLLRRVPVAHYKTLAPGAAVAVRQSPALLALDGEREVVVRAGERVTIRLSHKGPHVIDIDQTMQRAVAAGAFVADATGGRG